MTGIKVPGFIEEMRRFHAIGRNLIILTGDTDGLYYSEGNCAYCALPELVIGELGTKFHVLSFDINGIDFSNDEVLEELAAASEDAPGGSLPRGIIDRFETFLEKKNAGSFPGRDDKGQLGELIKKIAETDYSPLHSLELLRHFCELSSPGSGGHSVPKPVCVFIRDAAILFPDKGSGDLTSEQAHRLQAFLNWMRSKNFALSKHLVIMVSDTLADLNKAVLELANAVHFEIPMPAAEEYLAFIQGYLDGLHRNVSMSAKEIARYARGLSLTALKSVLDQTEAEQANITVGILTEAVNKELKKRLGSIVAFKRPTHGLDDVIGYEKVKEVLCEILIDCKDPSIADSMVLLVGSNGSGKTFIGEAAANWSGRVVIELSKVRDSLFGGTEKFFEQFRFVAESFDNLLVLMDEADAEMGNVNSEQTHEVEKRLTAGIQKMASDKRYRGRLVWFLMTARAGKLSSDVISRCDSVVPIFDLAGDERKQFVKVSLDRVQTNLSDADMDMLLAKTEHFSNRDFDKLFRKVAARKTSPLEVLKRWAPGKTIRLRRQYQELLAADFSTYPHLIPERIASLSEKELADRRQEMEFMLGD